MEDFTLTRPTNSIDEITRINQISLKDDLPQKEKKQNARAILNIAEEKPSDETVTQAYKKLALKTHPDRHSKSEEATQATQKLNKAKDILLMPEEPEEDFADKIWGASCWCVSRSSPDDEQRTQKMKGWVEHIRGILFAFSIPNCLPTQSRLYDLSSSTRQQITKYFNRVLFKDLKESCRDGTYTDLKIEEDVKSLSEWATKFFSDPYQDSAQAVNCYSGTLKELKYEELEAIYHNLLEMVDRYDCFKNRYRKLFQDAVLDCFTKIEEKLTKILLQLKSTDQSDKPLVTYRNFMEFAAAFVGQKEPVLNYLEDDLLETTKEALTFLDNLVFKKNPQFFSRLVALANELRAQLDPHAAFIYSNTSLEKELKQAKKMDDLCKGHTQLSILNAQLSYCIFLIVGDYFKPQVAEELTDRFPKIKGTFEQRLSAPLSVMPSREGDALITIYQKYYGNGYAFFRMFASYEHLTTPDGYVATSDIQNKLYWLLQRLQNTLIPRGYSVPESNVKHGAAKKIQTQPALQTQTFSASAEMPKKPGFGICILSLLFFLCAGLLTMGALAAAGNFDVAAYLFGFLEHSTDSLVTLFLPAAVVGVGFLYTMYVYHQSLEKENSLNMVFDEKEWQVSSSGTNVAREKNYSSTFSENPLKSSSQADSSPNAEPLFPTIV